MAQLQQIHKKHLEQQQRQSQSQQQHHNSNNNNNGNGGNSNGGHKERSNTLSQLLEKNRNEGRGPQQTKAALTMPSSFQRSERALGLGGASGSAFGGLPSHLPHLPVIVDNYYISIGPRSCPFKWELELVALIDDLLIGTATT